VSDPSDAASLSYLDALLRVAVTQRAVPIDPVAGRVIVPLLGMAMAQGGGPLIAQYLTPQPGRTATYEVRHIDPEDEAPTVLSGNLNAMAALRGAIRISRQGTSGVAVVGRTEDGVERCCVIRTDDGVLEYLFPSRSAYEGPAGAVDDALHVWEETFRQWGGEPLARHAMAHVTSATERTPERLPTAAEIADAIQLSLLQMTVDVNLAEVESLIKRTIESTFGTLEGAPSAAPVATSATLLAAADLVAERISAVVGEDLGPLLRQASDRTATEVAERVADHVAALLDERTAPPPPAPPLPVARRGDDIEPLLAEMAATQDQFLSALSGQAAVSARLGGAIEHLGLQVQEMREQSRASAAVLNTLSEQVSSFARRSETFAERVTAAMGQELDQFSDRIRGHLVNMEAAAKRSAVDGAVPHAMSRLTSMLARVEVQLEEVVQRWNGTPADPKRPTR
jgi:hypothetical protein